MTIFCTVTNDLTFDQRMLRICTALAQNGYSVELVGRVLPHSLPLDERAFRQHRIRCRFHKGFAFYAEYNLRLFFYLLRTRYDAVCSVDLDTLPAGCLASLLRGKKRVYDAHEYFTEVPEVTGRPFVKLFWAAVARVCLPFYRHAYTVGPALAAVLQKKYGLPFSVVRNVPVAALKNDAGRVGDAPVAAGTWPADSSTRKILLYQGALNEGRGIEHVLAAMRDLDGIEFWLAGEGDLSARLREQAQALGVQDKVRFLGFVKPADLKRITPKAWLGLNLFEAKGLNYYYSMANKFFDYVQAGVPVLSVDFPEYRALTAQYEVAVLLDRLEPAAIVSAIQRLQNNPEIHERLRQASAVAARVWNWENEETALLEAWAGVWGH